MEFCKYRTLAKVEKWMKGARPRISGFLQVVDYIGSLSTLGTKCLLGMGEEDQLAPAGGDWLSVQDKVGRGEGRGPSSSGSHLNFDIPKVKLLAHQCPSIVRFQIVLLRHSFAPLALFDIASGKIEQ